MTTPLALDVWNALDELGRRIRSAPTPGHVWALVEVLAQHRTNCTPEDWKAFCQDFASHALVQLLVEDPYTRDARAKPAGYAGDARTLDYVYLRDISTHDVSDLGLRLFSTTTSVPIADAVRERCSIIAEAIARHAEAGVNSLSIASIACGHLRELDRVPPHVRSRLRAWVLEQDARSVEMCVARIGGVQLSAQVGTVRDVLIGRVRIPESDVVYASGLFDYLDDRAAGLLIRRMVASLRPGGFVLVPNLTPANQEIAYMEAVMDWWMVYRTTDDLIRLANAAPVDVEIEAFTSSQGRVAWARITRFSR